MHNQRGDSPSVYPLSMKHGAFIHARQHLSKDSIGVLWVDGNPMPPSQHEDASTSLHRDTSPLKLERGSQTQSPLPRPYRPLKSRIILSPDTAPSLSHIFHSGLPDACLNLQIFLCFPSFHLFSFTLSHLLYQLFPSLFSFCSSSPSACRELPGGQNRNRHQNSLLLLFFGLTDYPARGLLQETFSSSWLNVKALISVRQNFLWTIDKAGARAVHKTVRQPVFLSQVLPNWPDPKLHISSVFTSQKSDTDSKRKCQINLYKQCNPPH